MKKINNFIKIIFFIFIMFIFITIYIDIQTNKQQFKQLQLDYQNSIEKNKKLINIQNKLISNNLEIKKFLLDSLYYLNPNIDTQIQIQIVESLIVECKKVNLPPLLVLCLIKEESMFNPLAKSSMGAIRLMQIIPKFHNNKITKNKLKPNEVYYIKNNIQLGCEILKEYFNDKKNIVEALQKYVGAINKKNASKYIENIINNYITLEIMYTKQ